MLLDSGAGNRPSRKSSRDRICSSPMPTKYSKLVTAQEISNSLVSKLSKCPQEQRAELIKSFEQLMDIFFRYQ